MAARGVMVRVEASHLSEWAMWLKRRHKMSPGAWLITYLKGRGPYVAPSEANAEALRYGWFRAHQVRADELRMAYLYRPRRPHLSWSSSDRVETLRQIQTGEIHPSGLERAQQAQRDGSWSLADETRLSATPLDLIELLDRNPKTRTRFDMLDPLSKQQLMAQLAFDTRQRRGDRSELLENLVYTVDRIDPVNSSSTVKLVSISDYVDIFLSRRIIRSFEIAQSERSHLVLTGPPGLSKSSSCAEFLRRTEGAVLVPLSADCKNSWTRMRSCLAKAARSLGTMRTHVGVGLGGRDGTRLLVSAIRAVKSSSRGVFRNTATSIDRITFVIDDAQRLSDRLILQLLEINEEISPNVVGIILIGTPELAARMKAIHTSLKPSGDPVIIQELATSDLTLSDMGRFLRSRGVRDAAIRRGIVAQLVNDGTWTLRAAERLAAKRRLPPP